MKSKIIEGMSGPLPVVKGGMTGPIPPRNFSDAQKKNLSLLQGQVLRGYSGHLPQRGFTGPVPQIHRTDTKKREKSDERPH